MSVPLAAMLLAAQGSPAEIEADSTGALILRIPVGQPGRIEQVDPSGNVVASSKVLHLT